MQDFNALAESGFSMVTRFQSFNNNFADFLMPFIVSVFIIFRSFEAMYGLKKALVSFVNNSNRLRAGKQMKASY